MAPAIADPAEGDVDLPDDKPDWAAKRSGSRVSHWVAVGIDFMGGVVQGKLA
jgi:hypothetical protein